MFGRSSEPGPPPAQQYIRSSNAFEQFCSSVREETGLWLLDLSELSQANVGFLTGLGHRLSTEDYLRNASQWFKGEEPSPVTAREFLEENLNYPPQSFDGVLAWDVFEFLPNDLVVPTVARLRDLIKPGRYILAMFHSPEKGAPVASYRYRIQDSKTLELQPRSSQRPVQVYNNRGLEKLFAGFESLKFFLTRDQLREVLIRR